MWNTKTRVIPTVVMTGAFGEKSLITKYLAPIGVIITGNGDNMQKTQTAAMLGSVRILR